MFKSNCYVSYSYYYYLELSKDYKDMESAMTEDVRTTLSVPENMPSLSY